jgi:hypothetical protein
MTWELLYWLFGGFACIVLIAVIWDLLEWQAAKRREANRWQRGIDLERRK